MRLRKAYKWHAARLPIVRAVGHDRMSRVANELFRDIAAHPCIYKRLTKSGRPEFPAKTIRGKLPGPLY